MLKTIVVALFGLVLGHLIRRVTPWLLNWKERVLPFSWPWPECLLAAVFLLIRFQFGTDLPDLPFYAFSLFLLAVASCDRFSKYISMQVIYTGLVVGVLSSAVFPHAMLSFADQGLLLPLLGFEPYPSLLAGLVLSVVGAGVGYLCLEVFRRIFGAVASTEVMGAGDAFILMMIGAFIGPKLALFTLFPACILGIIGGLLERVFSENPHAPFGPSLALGSVLVLLYHDAFLAGIDRFQLFVANLSAGALIGVMAFLLLVLVLLMVRLRRKASEYEAMIEKDYAETDKNIK